LWRYALSLEVAQVAWTAAHLSPGLRGYRGRRRGYLAGRRTSRWGCAPCLERFAGSLEGGTGIIGRFVGALESGAGCWLSLLNCYLHLKAACNGAAGDRKWIMSTAKLPVRQFRCRIEELGPLDQMVRAIFLTNKSDYAKASPDYADPDFLKGWDGAQAAFEKLVPTTARRATDKEVTEAMTTVAKSLREPLNFLNIRLNRVAKDKSLTVAADKFGLAEVRNEITTSDMEGLDGALKYLIQLLQMPQNLTALTAKGHTDVDTQAFIDARQQVRDLNTTQNSNQNAALELTEDNIKAGNALWAYVAEVLETGRLLYKESQPKKARTFTLATLMKRIRREQGHSGDGGEE
jgi:hypothetical protein